MYKIYVFLQNNTNRMKRFSVVAFLLCLTLAAAARPKGDLTLRHQVRIGWGDMLFETMAFHASPVHYYPVPEALPANFTTKEKHSYTYTGHLFAEYQYRASRVVRVGAMLDVEGIFWKEDSYDRYHNQTGVTVPVRNYDIVVMPTVRFDYFNKEYVSLYSGLGAGLLVALDNHGGCEPAPAFNLNLIGVQVGHGHWWGAAELGLLSALTGGDRIYMLGSRLISFSLNYRW